VLRGEQDRRDKPIGFESREQIAWTTQRYKLYSDDGGETWRLYDLVADPGENHDIADRRPDLAESLIRQAERWRASVRRSRNRDKDKSEPGSD
jgi:arylsulfatase A-like enzyme